MYSLVCDNGMIEINGLCKYIKIYKKGQKEPSFYFNKFCNELSKTVFSLSNFKQIMSFESQSIILDFKNFCLFPAPSLLTISQLQSKDSL